MRTRIEVFVVLCLLGLATSFGMRWQGAREDAIREQGRAVELIRLREMAEQEAQEA